MIGILSLISVSKFIKKGLYYNPIEEERMREKESFTQFIATSTTKFGIDNLFVAISLAIERKLWKGESRTIAVTNSSCPC